MVETLYYALDIRFDTYTILQKGSQNRNISKPGIWIINYVSDTHSYSLWAYDFISSLKVWYKVRLPIRLLGSMKTLYAAKLFVKGGTFYAGSRSTIPHITVLSISKNVPKHITGW